ncbi:hypothetical protein GGTG_12099 [Gaeumannomyces tritici R3-111a-1]|uniref:Uncharacterized protein n=1 Tax=Gaeumannomyces tritici (strain R3-111a-1) TaxID=644352 RepID=J3PF20_GAET3|nr:hypothetical protein GGTG_12099 [Gaeumannomyces tritici R3-111a-1]EJT71078.1 hypothetical protein GGTG_12099 [Gaeumannomyces tritici R3-111a-1]
MKRKLSLAVFRAKLQVDCAMSAVADPSPVTAAEEQASQPHMQTAATKAAVTIKFTKLDPAHFSKRPARDRSALSDLHAVESGGLGRRVRDALGWLQEERLQEEIDYGRSVLGAKVRMLWRRYINGSDESSPTAPPMAAVQKITATRGGRGGSDDKMVDTPQREGVPTHRRTSSTGSGGHITSLLDQCPVESFTRLYRDEAVAEQNGRHREPGLECCNCHVQLSDMDWTCWHCKVHVRCRDCKR